MPPQSREKELEYIEQWGSGIPGIFRKTALGEEIALEFAFFGSEFSKALKTAGFLFQSKSSRPDPKDQTAQER